MAWYLVHRGQRTGPYDEVQLRQLAYYGHIPPGTSCMDADGRPASLEAITAIRPPAKQGDVGIHTFMLVRSSATGVVMLLTMAVVLAVVLVTKLAPFLHEVAGIDYLLTLLVPTFVAGMIAAFVMQRVMAKKLFARCRRCSGRARAVRHDRSWAFRCTDCGHYEVTYYGRG